MLERLPRERQASAARRPQDGPRHFHNNSILLVPVRRLRPPPVKQRHWRRHTVWGVPPRLRADTTPPPSGRLVSLKEWREPGLVCFSEKRCHHI